MIDLSEISGLPIKYDEDKGKFYCEGNLNLSGESQVAIRELLPVLLNKNLKYPEKVYRHYKSVSFSEDVIDPRVSYDMIYIPYGLLGIEFIKTHVYHSQSVENKCDCIIEVLHGTLTVFIQRNQDKEDPYQFETYVDEIALITLRQGEKLSIPCGVFYTFVNTGVVPVMFSKISSPTHKETDYNDLRRERGLAYFLISKNAKIEVVANPKYRLNCKIKYLNGKKLLKEEFTPYLINEIKTQDSLYNLYREKKLVELFSY